MPGGQESCTFRLLSLLGFHLDPVLWLHSVRRPTQASGGHQTQSGCILKVMTNLHIWHSHFGTTPHSPCKHYQLHSSLHSRHHSFLRLNHDKERSLISGTTVATHDCTPQNPVSMVHLDRGICNICDLKMVCTHMAIVVEGVIGQARSVCYWCSPLTGAGCAASVHQGPS